VDYRGLANFLSLVSSVSALNFIQTARAFDATKTLSTPAFKEYSSLTTEYWEKFVGWIADKTSEITTSTVNQKLKLLRRHHYVTIHVMHPENVYVHPDRSMLSYILPFTDIGECFLREYWDSGLYHEVHGVTVWARNVDFGGDRQGGEQGEVWCRSRMETFAECPYLQREV
jgi:hypothetical protein